MDALWEFHQRNGTIHGFPGARPSDPAELLVTECEILIPAATENQITSRNADRVKCKILAEGANGPTTATADEILADKRVFVIPDILCNAGGVTTSYFEWVQDRQGYFWKESVVNEQLEHIMKAAFEDVVRYRRDTRSEQPHRRLHAGHRPRGLHHSPTRNLRLARGVGRAPAPAALKVDCAPTRAGKISQQELFFCVAVAGVPSHESAIKVKRNGGGLGHPPHGNP